MNATELFKKYVDAVNAHMDTSRAGGNVNASWAKVSLLKGEALRAGYPEHDLDMVYRNAVVALMA